MGLDGVELIIEVEESFGIKIEDDEAVQILTAGQLADVITRKLTGIKGADCPTAKAFYRLRRSFLSVFELNRRQLRPTTPILNFLPLAGRRQIWTHLERDLSLRLPPLSDHTGIGVFGGAAIAYIAAYLVFAAITGDLIAALIAGLVALLPGVLLGYVVGVFFMPTLQPQHRTLGGLARGIVAYNYQQLVPSPIEIPENEEVWNKLCDLIVKQIGVKREKIQRVTKFVDDLGF